MEPAAALARLAAMRSPIAVLALAALLGACARAGDETSAANAPASPPPAASPAATAPLAPAPQSAPATAADAPALAVEGEGLRLFNPQSGAARPMSFGTPRATVLTALAFRAPPEIGRQEECGAGPLDYAVWRDGLKLYFQADKLTGWALDRRAAGSVGTAAGIGPGSTRAALEDAQTITVMQSSLGTEFTSGGLSGVLDGPGKVAKITDMWAGAGCVMR